MEFSDRLREARKQAGFSQAKLAKMVGITTRSLQYYESGQRKPQSSNVVQALAQALGVPVSDLSGETEPPVQKTVFQSAYSIAGREQLNEILASLQSLMEGGVLQEEEERAFMCAVNDIYFNSRKKNAIVHRTYHVEDYLEQK